MSKVVATIWWGFAHVPGSSPAGPPREILTGGTKNGTGPTYFLGPSSKLVERICIAIRICCHVKIYI